MPREKENGTRTDIEFGGKRRSYDTKDIGNKKECPRSSFDP